MHPPVGDDMSWLEGARSCVRGLVESGAMERARRCYIHIGLPKTGTSYLQSILWQSREALSRQRVQMLPDSELDNFRMMLALRGLLRPHIDPPVAYGALDRFRQQAAESTAETALITQELLGACTVDEISTLLEAVERYETHLVITVRDLATWAVSAWQQQVRARGTRTLDQYLDQLAGVNGGTAPAAYDVMGVLDRWTPRFPAERVHIVTVPTRGTAQSVLLERFCAVLGADVNTLDTATPSSNTSLGLVQTEVLRRVNVALGDRLATLRAGYREQGKQFLGARILHPQRGAAARMPASRADWCDAASAALVDRIRTSGYDVVGELHELVPAPEEYTSEAQDVSDRDVAASAIDALAAILDNRADERKELQDLKATIREQRRRLREQRRQIRDLSAPRASPVRALGRLARAAVRRH